jgi:hypothetical protein
VNARCDDASVIIDLPTGLHFPLWAKRFATQTD